MTSAGGHALEPYSDLSRTSPEAPGDGRRRRQLVGYKTHARKKKILLLSRMSSDQPKFGIAFRYNLIHCQNRLSIIFANVFSVKIAKTQGRRRASKPEDKKAKPNVFTNDTSIDWIRERHETTRAEENMIRRRKLKRTRTVPAQI